jgi:hypothetical protein
VNDFDTIFETLEKYQVQCLIVGGVAVVLHGYPRFTADIDLVCKFEEQQLKNLITALKDLGYNPRVAISVEDLVVPSIRKDLKERNMIVLSFYSSRYPMTAVDIFVNHPFDFEEVYQKSIPYNETYKSVKVINKKDLIEMKEKVGRDIDKMDIQALRVKTSNEI